MSVSNLSQRDRYEGFNAEIFCGRISTLLSHNSACTPSSLGPGSHFDSGTFVTHVSAWISKPIRMTGKQTTHGAPTNFPSCIGFIPEKIRSSAGTGTYFAPVLYKPDGNHRQNQWRRSKIFFPFEH